MLAGTQGEWLWDPQADDGTVSNVPVFALLVLVATAGFGLLLLAVLGLRGHASPTRPARVGARLSAAGAALLVAFGLTALTTAIVSGQPWEPSFVAFLLGLLLLTIGALTWGVALRRHLTGGWRVMVLAGASGFAALMTEADPWHDLALSVSFLSWSALGALLLRGRRPAEDLSGVRRSARASRAASSRS
jgi:energy-converting hydrogenase Eha subunit A